MYLTTFLMLYLTSFQPDFGRAFGANRLIYKEGVEIHQIKAAIDELPEHHKRDLIRIALASPSGLDLHGPYDMAIAPLFNELNQRPDGGINGQNKLFSFGKNGEPIGLHPMVRVAVVSILAASNQVERAPLVWEDRPATAPRIQPEEMRPDDPQYNP